MNNATMDRRRSVAEERAYLTLDQIKAESLKLLCAFDSFCEEKGLRYSLAGGTMLGAVRHGGFIPWDDDVDVMLPRPDYERLLLLSEELQDKTGFILQSYPSAHMENPPFMMLVNPSIKRKFHYLDEIFYFGIDVFPVDGLPADEEEVVKIYAHANQLRSLIRASHADLSLGKTPARRLMKNVFAVVDSFTSIGKKSEERLVALARQYPYEESVYVGDVAWGLYGPGERMEKKAFEKFDTISFEGHQFKIVSCWDDYLSGLYGDYMQLPPEEDRRPHELEVWV